MKKPIITFIMVFLLLGGMSSSADDAMSKLTADSGSEANLVSSDSRTDTSSATKASVPDTATMLLIATGLIGLAAVSRSKN